MAILAEQLIKSFKSIGITRVFGLPGGPSIPYLEAMRENGLEFILVANEQSAGIMAAVTGRLTGLPGVCHATFGPGATNLATGIGCALLDRAPVIALTTEVKDAERGRKIQMNVDHQALFKPLTKWTARLAGDNFRETVKKAFEIALKEPPGPVHLGLPVDIAGIELDSHCLVEDVEAGGLPRPDPVLLKRAARALAKAKRPILAVGLTASRLGLQEKVREFAEKNNIPVFLTPMAKGILPEHHPCYGGVLFHALSDLAAKIYRRADLVIGLGYDPVEFNYESWMPPVPLIHLDTEPVDIAPEYEVLCDLTGDLAQSLAYLNTAQLPPYQWDADEIRTNTEKIRQALRPKTDAFSPADFFCVLQEVLPGNSILTGDVGAHLHLMGQFWQVREPNRMLVTNGWSTMGFGIPAALGAKICRPQNPVVCVTGDGGFLMNCGELLTARRLGLNIVVIVLCDGSMSLIEVKQRFKNLPPYGTRLYEGEYLGSDRFFGVPVLKAGDGGELKERIRQAFSLNGPVLIEAYVEGGIYEKMIVRSFK